MTTARRHDSLVPLSRQHHYGLMLCLGIHKGLLQHKDDTVWLQAKAQDVREFFQLDLVSHFALEEEVLFPVMERMPEAEELIKRLLQEHREIEKLVQELVQSSLLATNLRRLADLLEEHIRQEERLLFPLFQRHVSAEIVTKVEQAVAARIGTAMQPSKLSLIS